MLQSALTQLHYVTSFNTCFGFFYKTIFRPSLTAQSYTQCVHTLCDPCVFTQNHNNRENMFKNAKFMMGYKGKGKGRSFIPFKLCGPLYATIDLMDFVPIRNLPQLTALGWWAILIFICTSHSRGQHVPNDVNRPVKDVNTMSQHPNAPAVDTETNAFLMLPPYTTLRVLHLRMCDTRKLSNVLWFT